MTPGPSDGDLARRRPRLGSEHLTDQPVVAEWSASRNLREAAYPKDARVRVRVPAAARAFAASCCHLLLPPRPLATVTERRRGEVMSERSSGGAIYAQRLRFRLTAAAAVLFLALVSTGLSHQRELHARRWQAAVEPDSTRCYRAHPEDAVSTDFIPDERWHSALARSRTTPAWRPSVCQPGVKIRWFRRRASYGANTDASRQLGRFTFSPSVLLAGDIEVNPGPTANRAAAPVRPRRRVADAGGDSTGHNQPSSMTVIYQNCRSLRNKLGVLRAHSPELVRYDFVALTETWLSQDVTDAELQSSFNIHSWFRRDRPTHGGGVACAVRSNLSPARRHDLEPDDAELLLLELSTTPKLMVGTCYCPPADDRALDRTMAALRAVVQRYPDRCIVVTGDFNVSELSWSAAESGGAIPTASRSTRRVMNFVDACEEAGLKQFVCVPTRGANTLDLTLCNKPCVTDVNVHDGFFDSDHKQVEFTVRNVTTAAPLTTRRSAFNYKQADFDRMRASLQLLPWTVLDSMHVDAAVDAFYDLLNAVISDCIPVVDIKRNYPPWFDRGLRDLLREKETAFRRLKRNRCEETEQIFRNKRREFRNLANQKYSDYLVGLTVEFKTNPKRFWSFLKCTKSGTKGLSALKVDGVEVTDDRDKANALNRAFAAKFTDSPVTVLPQCPSYNLSPLTHFECNADLVKSIMENIPVNKACGPDGISARIIRECSGALSVPIAKICKLSLSQGVFPTYWKKANVVPLFKKGNVKDPANYRSVSLIPLFGKVLEKVVYLSLLRHVTPAISPEQHGFVPGRSCATNLATLLSAAYNSIDEQCQTDCVYTDFSAAFQSVNHRLLIHKLKTSYHISGSALSWLTSYLNNRQQRVVVNGKCSDWCCVTSGTPEGGVISALCFALFINDLSVGMSSRVLLFADDAKIYRKIACPNDATSLQGDLERLHQWSKTWHLRLNPSKCKTFRMTLKTKPLVTAYSIGGTVLEHVNEIRDLGVILDTKLTFGPHVHQLVSKTNRALGVLIRSYQKTPIVEFPAKPDTFKRRLLNTDIFRLTFSNV